MKKLPYILIEMTEQADAPTGHYAVSYGDSPEEAAQVAPRFNMNKVKACPMLSGELSRDSFERLTILAEDGSLTFVDKKA